MNQEDSKKCVYKVFTMRLRKCGVTTIDVDKLYNVIVKNKIVPTRVNHHVFSTKEELYTCFVSDGYFTIYVHPTHKTVYFDFCTTGVHDFGRIGAKMKTFFKSRAIDCKLQGR